MTHLPGKQRKWLYPVLYLLFVVISMLPPYAEKPFAPQDTQDVITNLLMVAVNPHKAWAPVFHLATILLVVLVAIRPKGMGRILAGYVGLDYLVIALAQTMGTTARYGFVLHTSALIACGILGITWLIVAARGELQASFENVPLRRYWSLPLALLAFWAPYTPHGAGVRPFFDPLLLLTSPDFGLTFCLTTPVFLFLLVLFYPNVNRFAYRLTAFNGLLYGLFNLTHWFRPELRWMGVLHLPLLLISLQALILPEVARD